MKQDLLERYVVPVIVVMLLRRTTTLHVLRTMMCVSQLLSFSPWFIPTYTVISRAHTFLLKIFKTNR